MSIIAEALKKAQNKRSEELVLKSTEDGSIVLESRAGSISDTSRPRNILILSITGMVLILAIGTGIFFWTLRHASFSTDVPQKTIAKNEKPFSQTEGILSTSPVPHRVNKKVATDRTPKKASDSGHLEQDTPVINMATPAAAYTPVIKKTPPVLEGIMYSPSRPQAILNGRIVSKGETINGFRVDDIFPEKVTVSFDGEKSELRLR